MTADLPVMRYALEIVDGVLHEANACSDCLKPFVPYAVAIPTDDERRYCWRTHEQDAVLCENEDLRAAIESVLALHTFSSSPASTFAFCDECDGSGPGQVWPCPTVLAIHRHVAPHAFGA